MVMNIINRLVLMILVAFPSLAAAQTHVQETIIESHGLSMFGDLHYPSGFKHFDYVNPNAPKGGKVRHYALGSFDSLNPFILKGSPAQMVGATWDSLLVQSRDEAFSAYGLVAEKIRYPENRKWVEFILRKEARWHDGKPLTADDVMFTVETLKQHGHPLYRTLLKEVSRIDILSAYHIRFYFGQYANRELPLIVGTLPILPKHYFANRAFDKSTNEPILGSGPYRVSKVELGRSLHLQRFADYWGRDLPVQRGRHNFDDIIYDYYRDMTVAIEAFKAGKYDFRQESIAKIWAKAYNIDAVRDGRIVKEEIPHRIPQGMQAFILNLRNPIFQDLRVRKALNLAFDFEWENKTLFYNAYTRLDSYFANSEFSSAATLPSKEEQTLLAPFIKQLPNELWTMPFVHFKTDGSGYGVRTSLVQAASLLKQAGYELKGQELVHQQTGRNLKIEFLVDQPAFERVIAPYVRNLKKLGIEATIRTIDSAQYEKRLQQFDYDVVVDTFAQSPSPGNEQLNYWHSSKADIPGTRNLLGLKSPVIDHIVEQLIRAQTKEQLITATRALDRVLLWNYYVIPNWYSASFRVLYWSYIKRPALNPPYGLALETWWYEAASGSNNK